MVMPWQALLCCLIALAPVPEEKAGKVYKGEDSPVLEGEIKAGEYHVLYRSYYDAKKGRCITELKRAGPPVTFRCPEIRGLDGKVTLLGDKWGRATPGPLGPGRKAPQGGRAQKVPFTVYDGRPQKVLAVKSIRVYVPVGRTLEDEKREWERRFGRREDEGNKDKSGR
jgi:hypothetical protein